MHLTAVAGSHTEDGVDFCSWCGRSGSDGERVCSHCGLGVRLRTTHGVTIGPDAAFLIVRPDGRVSAASARAERLLGRHLTGRQYAAIDLGRRTPVHVGCGDPPATLVLLGNA